MATVIIVVWSGAAIVVKEGQIAHSKGSAWYSDPIFCLLIVIE